MAKVSVIVPIYNVDKYLNRCLDSLVNQTLEDIQIILVNDGSTDNSGQIAKQYEKTYKDKILYLEKENGGLSDARNYGIPYAKGEYLAFLDSDDYIEKDAYKEMYEKAKKEDADYVECDFIWEYPNKEKVDKRLIFNNEKNDIPNKINELSTNEKILINRRQMLCFTRVVAWNKLIKTKIIVENNIQFPKGLRYEDVEFTYKLIPYLNKISYVDRPFIHYIQRENSIVNLQNERTAEIFTILENVINYYKENKIYEQYEEELEYNYARYLLCSSLKRICKIKDKKIRKELINKTWKNLNQKFPNWKRNKILNSVKTNKNRYMRTINKFTYKIYTKIFSI